MMDGIKDKVIIGFKAFEHDMTCIGKQYKENTKYIENGTEMCQKGMMHFCEDPINLFQYYPFIDKNCEFTRFAEVEGSGNIIHDSHKDKIAVTKLKIKNEIPFRTFIDMLIGLYK